MHSGTPAHKDWIKTLPKSKMVMPSGFGHRLKYLIWAAVVTPIHPTVRKSLAFFHLMKSTGRQPFLLGSIAPHVSIEEFVAHLVTNGYGNHPIAWDDGSEIVSLRLLKDFKYQYHVRIFEDRAVHGHHEYTPECHPLLHLFDVDREDRRAEFIALVGDRLIEHKAADPSRYQWEFLSIVRHRSRQTGS